MQPLFCVLGAGGMAGICAAQRDSLARSRSWTCKAYFLQLLTCSQVRMFYHDFKISKDSPAVSLDSEAARKVK